MIGRFELYGPNIRIQSINLSSFMYFFFLNKPFLHLIKRKKEKLDFGSSGCIIIWRKYPKFILVFLFLLFGLLLDACAGC